MSRRPAPRVTVFWVLLLAILASGEAWAEGRVALVIGNSEYKNVGRLQNPEGDAKAIARALESLGFETTLALDQDRGSLEQALRRFTGKARNADIAAIYYAGHGMEASGENYLVPTDAALASDEDIDYELVPLELVLKAVSGAKQLRLVMLDACRNNPFARRMAQSGGTRAVGRGFVRVEPITNTLVAYAAKDGTTADDGAGEHSPFTAALLKRLPDPGVEITFVFRKVRDDVLAATDRQQEPFVYGSLGGEPVYLAAPPEASMSAPSPGPAATVDPQAIELSFWNAIQGKEDPALYEAYLAQYPNGSFAILAQAEVQRLKAAEGKDTQVTALTPEATPPGDPAPSPPPAAPAITELSGTYVALQSANMREGPSTDAKVLARLHADDAVAVTGKVKDADWYRVERDGQAAFVSAKLLRPVDADEVKAWRRVTAAPKLEAVDAFLNQYPNGYFKAKAEMLQASLSPKPEPIPVPSPTVTSATPANLVAGKEIRVGEAYLLNAPLKTSWLGSMPMKGKIVITSGSSGAFRGRAEGLTVNGGEVSAGEVTLTQNGNTLRLDFETAAGDARFDMESVEPGEYSGNGSVMIEWGGSIRLLGTATLSWQRS